MPKRRQPAQARGKVYCASVMGSSIFLSAAQVKNRKASERMGREFPKKTGIPFPSRCRTWDMGAIPFRRSLNRGHELDINVNFLFWYVANCRDFTILVEGLLQFISPGAFSPADLIPDFSPVNLHRIPVPSERNAVTPAHNRIGDIAYGDEGGVVCTPFSRNDDSD